MKAVDINESFPKVENKLLQYWKEKNIFSRSVREHPGSSCQSKAENSQKEKKSYVFYDGPPFATGLPHYGHLLAGTIKDVVGRFFAMKGFEVERRFGWDCHGVPVEFEVQKSLDLHGAKAIKEFGIGKFNEECRKIVLRYTAEWEKFVERSGRWVDFKNNYRTMDPDYMESIWWVVKCLWDRELVYRGVKCVPYSWAINTPLSNFEANLSYKQVQDPAITVRFVLDTDSAKEKLDLAAGDLEGIGDYQIVTYVWTTTPWTLPSNLALAVGADIDYSLIVVPDNKEIAIIATSLVNTVFPDFDSEGNLEAENSVRSIKQVKGSQLVGLEYQPLFPYFAAERERNAFRVYPGEFVSDSDGTGIVHLAAFGEDDLSVFQANDISIVDPVDDDGKFTDQVPDFAGEHVKEADKSIISFLKSEGQLVKHSTIEHSYPYCWRTDTPLIYKCIPTWFVKVESIREELEQINSLVHWVPEHIRDGRMGKWLAGAKDWAISRNRFWGTPLPIWECSSCGHTTCMGSVAELEEKSGEQVSDLHRHYIDQLSVSCSKCSEKMQRVSEVLDCWFESGSMPYAQAHYPFENKQKFEENFPADFIAEGLDQTRGWFYTLLVLSTALFGRPAFRNVIVNGIVLAEDGKKMSKSLRNYPPPDEIMEEFGADAMRLYLLASAATRGEELRFSKDGVKQITRQTLLPLWNAYNFFVTYALVDNWRPETSSETSSNLLDRWIISKTASLVSRVDKAISNYHLYAAVQPVLDYVDQLTNWYIRLNRKRFWAGNDVLHVEDKNHAYATLQKALVTFVRVLAPLAPFISEEIYLNLTEGKEEDSVHLCKFPSADEFKAFEVDKQLERAMELFEQIILLGRSVRNSSGCKIRQPLSSLTVIYPDREMLESIQMLDCYIRDELNVKCVEYSHDESRHVSLTAKLNTKELGKVLGAKLGSDGMKRLRKYCENLTTEQIRSVESGELLQFDDLTLGINDLIISRRSQSGIDAAASSGQITIVLDTNVTAPLRVEGLAREFVNRVQRLRKELGFDVADRIVISFMTADTQLSLALSEHADYIKSETLAVEIDEVSSERELRNCHAGGPSAQNIEGKAIVVCLSRIQG